MTNFFDKAEDKEEIQEPEKIKVGETEFTPEELQDLVGIGQKAKDWTEKAGVEFDELKTKFGKRGERIGEYKKRLEEYEQELNKFKNPPTPEQVDEEKVREQIVQEAKKYGLVTKEEAQQMIEELYTTRRSGERILASVNKVLRQANSDGKPVTTADKLLEFMADPSNPKDPDKAYKLMFEKELEDWKQKRIESLKKPTMLTETKSTAGTKQPEIKIPSNREELRNALRIAVRGEEGVQ